MKPESKILKTNHYEKTNFTKRHRTQSRRENFSDDLAEKSDTKCKFPDRISATGKNGEQIKFDYVETDLQRQITEKRNKLQNEFERLQASFDSGK